MLHNLEYLFICLFSFFVLSVSPVVALSSPNFPSCVSPLGSLVVSYDSGIHGIAGQSGEFSGSDKVYLLDSGNYLQCFCSSSGVGIQTNWWKINSASQEDLTILQKNGWVFIPTGSSWGLSSDPYLAYNQKYSCLPSNNNPSNNSFSQPGPGGAPVCNSAVPPAPRLLSVNRQGTSATLTWTKVDLATTYAIFYGVVPGQYIYGVPSTGNVTSFTINSLDKNKNYYFSIVAVNNCMPSVSSAANTAGQVLGASTGPQVLSLADTGTTTNLVIALAVFSLFSLAVLKYHRV